MNTLPPELRFPKPPFRLDSLPNAPSAQAVATGYLAEIQSWREMVVEFLGEPRDEVAANISGLTERAANALVCFLASRWSEEMQAYAHQCAYNIEPFPVEELEGAKGEAVDLVTEIFRWRAGVNDYLSDVWNVLGEPLLDLDECTALGLFLDPVSEKKVCCFCLSEFEGDDVHPEKHTCPLLDHARAKWPPALFQHWKAAPQVDREPKKWWQFWSKQEERG